MLFKSLGDLTARHAWLILAAWVAVVVASIAAAPSWDSVVENGEFAFLPVDSPSRVANAAFREAFPGDQMRSTLVLVARRESVDEGLLEEDFEYLSGHVIPELHRMAGIALNREADESGEAGEDDEGEAGEAPSKSPPENARDTSATGNQPSAGDDTASAAIVADAPARKDQPRQLVQEIMTFEDRRVGDLLISEDRQATSIVLSMTTEFLDQANRPLVDSVEKFVKDLSRIPSGQPNSLPAGLEISISGSATFGRDMMVESAKSAKSTEHWTVILVVVLLIAIYRAPMLAFIPLVTVAVATAVSRSLLAIGAQHGIVSLFNGIETYVTVLVYGAGVDYCLFLIARYREEMDGGQTIEEAISGTMERIGAALTASACTVMCGIGMMYFAEFGKFSQAGIAITFGLAVCLLASLTLTPAILRISGRWAFWPARIAQSRDTFPTGNSLFMRLQKAQLLTTGWSTMGRLLEQRPWTAFLASMLLLLPFSIAGIAWFGNLSYGLLSELPETSASVYGAAAAARHFPPGEVSPVTVMIEAEELDFSLARGPSYNAVKDLTDRLLRQKDELGLHSVRSLSRPRGRPEPANTSLAVRSAIKRHARDYFVSPGNRSITRITLIPKNDPFARSSIAEFRTLRSQLPALLPDSLRNARVWFVGNTAEISDLKDVTDRDQIRIDTLVMLGVYLILVALLRKPGICAYLMFTVLYSYFATLGFTFLVFRGMNPESFTGLDWKVPMFLFTILIAVGEDYNIFLMARIEEEQKIHGPLKGITVALERTGSIISSCGIIMAGTFSSLLAGSLVGMDQLGLALATGVILDTFIIRPIMVPSFMILLTTHRLGPISRLAGYGQTDPVARAA